MAAANMLILMVTFVLLFYNRKNQSLYNPKLHIMLFEKCHMCKYIKCSPEVPGVKVEGQESHSCN
jgi:hypothetical protein